jgi:type IX secretion system PorP/SprF family membrane protein
LKRYLIILFIIITNIAYSQDPHFSQFYSNPLYLSSSFAGLTDDNRLSLNYRNQWPEISHGYQTYSASFDKAIDRYNSGVGVFILQDVAGTGSLRNTNIGLFYSYDFKIKENFHIRPGLNFAYTQGSIYFDRLLWYDQIYPDINNPTSAEVFPMNRVNDIDFSTSVMAYNERFWLGTSIDHILRPNQSFYFIDNEDFNPGKVPLKYTVYGGAKFSGKESLLKTIPINTQFAFIYREQGEFRQLDLGMYLNKNPLVLGFWYRGIPLYKEFFNRDAFTVLVGVKNKNYSFGYSYDFTISKLFGSTGGSHEISLCYTFKTNIKIEKKKMVPCPEF